MPYAIIVARAQLWERDRRLRVSELRQSTATNCSHSGVARERLATFPQLDNTTTGSILAARRRSTAEFYISYELGPTFHIVYEPNPNP